MKSFTSKEHWLKNQQTVLSEGSNEEDEVNEEIEFCILSTKYR